MHDRRITQEWIVDTVRTPDWTESDPNDPNLERRFRTIEEFGSRILRGACIETEVVIRV
jgi:hypothetical protein